MAIALSLSARRCRIVSTLYVCEIKFSRNEITGAIIPEIRAKIGALSRPTAIISLVLSTWADC
jgi:hypothetical protein